MTSITEQALIRRVISGEHITDYEAYELPNLPLSVLIYCANIIRWRLNTTNTVTYTIDRNINITNICVSFCSFCNFCRKEIDEDAYVTTYEQYEQKIEELYLLGGRQILLQGGLNPKLRLDYYLDLFKFLKQRFSDLHIHALSPPEILFLSKIEQKSIYSILESLIQAGLDSLPGGGAEILCDKVRNVLSPSKFSSSEWLEVMRVAHQLGIVTTATMMFGHIESWTDRIEHLLKIRHLQSDARGVGFISFIPWIFQRNGTRLLQEYPDIPVIYASEYIKTIAIARIILHNIKHIQASWLTVGFDTAILALHSGADDLGGLMMEENVVASTGISRKITEQQMHSLIRTAGFIPALRDQNFQILKIYGHLS